MIQMEIQDYWNLSLKKQQCIQNFSETKTGHGTGAWHVRGIIITNGIEFCECEHCEGHEGEQEHLNVDEIVCSEYNEVADKAASTGCNKEGFWESEWTWQDGPFITPVKTFGNTEADIERYRKMIQ